MNRFRSSTNSRETAPRRHLLCLTSVVVAIALLPSVSSGSTAEATVDTLVLVNGEAITSADLDAVILETHAQGSMDEMNVESLSRLFEKAVNDRLLIQEAEALGIGDEREVRVPLAEQRAEDTRAAYVKDHFTYDAEVTEAEVREYFERYYWKIQVRQLSVRTQQRADSLRTAILGGAAMDTLAVGHSLDTHRLRGGAHNLKYWADVENELRDAARDLELEEVSVPFPYREAYALVRVEARHPVDWDALPTYEADIRGYLASERRKAEWRKFLDNLAARKSVITDETILAEIDADSADVLKGEFLEGSDRPVLSLDSYQRDEYQVRKAISHAAMGDGLAAYATVRSRGLNEQRDRLLVYQAAVAAGYVDDPGVVARHGKRREQALIEAYLAEFIASQIVFDRDEFQAFYDEHKEELRGPEQVKLDTIVLSDEQRAHALVFRLREGADFSFVAEMHGDDPHINISRGSWASGSVFSESIQRQIAVMEIGDTGDPVAIPTGWLVFQLAGRRPGEVEPIEAVDMQIRRVMYQKKFNELLRDHLKLLKERSKIVRDKDAIDKYFGG